MAQPPTDWLTHLLAHPSPKVWALSGNGLISSVEARRVHRECRLPHLRPFSSTLWVLLCLPRRVGGGANEKGAGWGHLLSEEKGGAGAPANST